MQIFTIERIKNAKCSKIAYWMAKTNQKIIVVQCIKIRKKLEKNIMGFYETHGLHRDKNNFPAADTVRGVHRLIDKIMTGKSIHKMKKAARMSELWPSIENSEGQTGFQ